MPESGLQWCNSTFYDIVHLQGPGADSRNLVKGGPTLKSTLKVQFSIPNRGGPTHKSEGTRPKECHFTMEKGGSDHLDPPLNPLLISLVESLHSSLRSLHVL